MRRTAPKWLLLLAVGASSALSLASASAQEADLPALRAAVKANPSDPDAALALGRALRRAGRFAEAATELTRGAGRAGAKGAALRYELARVKVDQRDHSGALVACKGLPPALAAACRAEAHLVQNRATEAMPEVERALKLDASLYEAKVAEGRALRLQGKVDEAQAALSTAAASAPGRPEAHFFAGELLLALGRKQEGLAALTRARGADANDPVIAFTLGEALGSSREARDALAAATRIRPGYAEAQAQLARVSLDLGDIAGADAAAQAAVRSDAKLFAAQVALGRVRIAQKRWDEALKAGEDAKKLIKNAAAGELIVADALAGKGDIDLAVDAYQRAFGLDRTDPAPLVRAATACREAGRSTTARGFVDRVTTDFPKWAPGWVEAAELALAQGDKPRARKALETALTAEGPVDKGAVRARLAAIK